jgi:predicted Fe-S protein YdhL (DUF1289 family)
MSYITPCISICTIDAATNMCIGCKRTRDQIKNWPNMTFEDRMEIMHQLGYGRRKTRINREDILRRYDKG